MDDVVVVVVTGAAASGTAPMRYMVYCDPSAVGDRSSAPALSTCRSVVAPYGDSSGAPTVVTTESSTQDIENERGSGVSAAWLSSSFAKPELCRQGAHTYRVPPPRRPRRGPAKRLRI